MIAISSFRPLADCPPDIALNQCRAYDSWRSVFDKIIWFGEYEEELAGPNTEFIGHLGKPRIALLAFTASREPDWTCLINADIFVGPQWRLVEQRLRMTAAHAALSLRYQGTPGNVFAVKDLGLDFFAAQPWVWRLVAEQCPERFRLGHILWDTWMIAFLMEVTKGNVADLTPARVIFHPVHEGRNDQSMEAPPDMGTVKWPTIKVS